MKEHGIALPEKPPSKKMQKLAAKLTKEEIVMGRLLKHRRITPAGCWEYGPTGSGRYGSIRYKGKQQYAHRVMYFLMNGQSDAWVLHSCDNPSCIRPDHLRAGTPKENAEDRALRTPPEQWVRKSDEEVRAAFERKVSESISTAQLARELGMSQPALHDRFKNIVRNLDLVI